VDTLMEAPEFSGSVNGTLREVDQMARDMCAAPPCSYSFDSGWIAMEFLEADRVRTLGQRAAGVPGVVADQALQVDVDQAVAVRARRRGKRASAIPRRAAPRGGRLRHQDMTSCRDSCRTSRLDLPFQLRRAM
jgi:hypothetical protein